jgi:predicted nucleic acid-binding protein
LGANIRLPKNHTFRLTTAIPRESYSSSYILPQFDEIFLTYALDGKADLIIRGDKHLLNLQECQTIPILTAGQFLDKLNH